jgi:hypothetical protein
VYRVSDVDLEKEVRAVRSLLIFLGTAALAVPALVEVAFASPTRELARSATKSAPLAAHVTYAASEFAPRVAITPPEAGWGGRQYVSHGYDWVVVDRRTGGVGMVSAPASHQSAQTTLQLLETTRADTAAVGIRITSRGVTTVAGRRSHEFSGVATGTFGHSFTPFSGQSAGNGEARGDRVHYDHGKAFRIVVADVHGHAVVFFIDSDAAALDPTFSAAADRLLAALRFPAS